MPPRVAHAVAASSRTGSSGGNKIRGRRAASGWELCGAASRSRADRDSLSTLPVADATRLPVDSGAQDCASDIFPLLVVRLESAATEQRSPGSVSLSQSRRAPLTSCAPISKTDNHRLLARDRTMATRSAVQASRLPEANRHDCRSLGSDWPGMPSRLFFRRSRIRYSELWNRDLAHTSRDSQISTRKINRRTVSRRPAVNWRLRTVA
jgi:hypothetical protein